MKPARLLMPAYRYNKMLAWFSSSIKASVQAELVSKISETAQLLQARLAQLLPVAPAALDADLSVADVARLAQSKAPIDNNPHAKASC